jgi:hypothetical protein
MLVLLLLIWLGILILAFRWRKWACLCFFLLILVGSLINVRNSGVEKQVDEKMRFRVVEIGDYRSVEFTTSRGESIAVVSSGLVTRLRGLTNQTVRVKMKGLYDYGKLRSFQILMVDDITE